MPIFFIRAPDVVVSRCLLLTQNQENASGLRRRCSASLLILMYSKCPPLVQTIHSFFGCLVSSFLLRRALDTRRLAVIVICCHPQLGRQVFGFCYPTSSCELYPVYWRSSNRLLLRTHCPQELEIYILGKQMDEICSFYIPLEAAQTDTGSSLLYLHA